MQITPDLIKYLESLARITLSESEEEKVGKELQDILTYIDTLNELDTTDVEAMSPVSYTHLTLPTNSRV